MEDAKRRGALCQSSAGSLWSCLTLIEEQSPDTEADSVQSRTAHREQLPGFGLGAGLVWCGWAGTPSSPSWELVQALWAVVSCVWGLLGDQLCTGQALEWCSHSDTVAPVSKQEDSWEASSTIPCSFHSTFQLQCWQTMASRSDRLHSIFLSGKFCGALNATWWTLEEKVFFI